MAGAPPAVGWSYQYWHRRRQRPEAPVVARTACARIALAMALFVLAGSSEAAGSRQPLDPKLLAEALQRVERENADLHDHRLVDLGMEPIGAGEGFLLSLLFEPAVSRRDVTRMTLVECRLRSGEVEACQRKDATAGSVDPGTRPYHPLLDPLRRFNEPDSLLLDPPLPERGQPLEAPPA